jgi:hypothetical protein
MLLRPLIKRKDEILQPESDLSGQQSLVSSAIQTNSSDFRCASPTFFAISAMFSIGFILSPVHYCSVRKALVVEDLQSRLQKPLKGFFRYVLRLKLSDSTSLGLIDSDGKEESCQWLWRRLAA